MSYQPYPTGGAAEPEPQRPAPPTPVLQAVRLMYAGAIVSAISLIITLVTVGSLKTAIHNADPSLSASKLHSAEVAAVAVAIIFGLIGVGLWLWMARMNGAGKSWARIVASVLFALSTLSVLTSIARPSAIETRILGLLVWLAGLGAIALLWQRESSDFFTSQSSRR
jgi:hypothetical protein